MTTVEILKKWLLHVLHVTLKVLSGLDWHFYSHEHGPSSGTKFTLVFCKHTGRGSQHTWQLQEESFQYFRTHCSDHPSISPFIKDETVYADVGTTLDLVSLSTGPASCNIPWAKLSGPPRNNLNRGVHSAGGSGGCASIGFNSSLPALQTQMQSSNMNHFCNKHHCLVTELRCRRYLKPLGFHGNSASRGKPFFPQKKTFRLAVSPSQTLT